MPLALGVLWTAVKQPASADIYRLALQVDKVLGLSLDKARPDEKPEAEAPEEVRAVAEQRRKARAEKNWQESDRLRDVIADMGYRVTDTKDGYKLEKIDNR